MGADANIFQQYLKPVKSVAEYDAERDAAADRKNAAQMNALQLAALTQKTERDNAFRTLVSTAPADPAERVKALRASGNPEAMQHADALEKNQLDMGKVRADTDKAAADAHGKNLDAKIKAHDFSLQQLQGVNDPESAHMWAINELKTGSVTPEQFMQGVAKIPSDPAQFQAWKKAAMQSGVSVLDNMKIENENARAKLTADTSRANNAASNAVTMRGQTLLNARGIEANKLKAQENNINLQGIVGKKIQDVELKLQDDYRAESKGFSETSTAMKKVMGAIETADKNPGSALAAGTAFMKILDPNSVVRESELGMALNASGWFDRAMNITNTLQSGKVMTATQKTNLKAAANDLFKEAKAAQLEIDAAYEKRAKDYGADPKRVIVNRGQNDTPQQPAKTQGGALSADEASELEQLRKQFGKGR